MPSSRIVERFEQCKVWSSWAPDVVFVFIAWRKVLGDAFLQAAKRTAFVAFVTAGYPTKSVTVDALLVAPSCLLYTGASERKATSVLQGTARAFESAECLMI